MKVSTKCIDLIESAEGFRGEVYRCPADVATIGFGSTMDTDGKAITMAHLPITRAQAVSLMLATLVHYEDAVNRYVTVTINQNQFDALVDFAYNLGIEALRGSTLLKLVNTQQFDGAANEFGKWTHAAGKVEPGLVKRRLVEKNLFLSHA
jgi:lysozyme